jgi:putative ABC transport system substrate-binding protein
MRRREFITFLGGAVTWPITASAQRPGGTLPRVIQLSPADNPSQADGTRRLLRELGYVEGRNIQIEFRNAGGNADALLTMAEEVVREGGVAVS